jgi:hypothetical protein
MIMQFYFVASKAKVPQSKNPDFEKNDVQVQSYCITLYRQQSPALLCRSVTFIPLTEYASVNALILPEFKLNLSVNSGTSTLLAHSYES